jgi:3-keto-disaccharide hydrolase
VPFQIAQHTIAIIKKGKNWNGKPLDSTGSLFRLLPALESKYRSGELAVAGPFLDSSDKLGLLMFYSSNHVQLKDELDKEDVVTNGALEFEIHPQFLGAGILQASGIESSPPKPGKPIELFDGHTFQGWEGDTARTWRIEKGALVGGSLTETVPHNEFLCTSREFKNFDLRLKVKLTGTGFVNGGIQFRSQRLKQPAFEMTGYQADMGEGYWGSLYDESRRNKTLAHTHARVIQQILHPNAWNEYIVRCEARHIRLWLNGVLTVDYTEDEESVPLAGFIGLQIHGGGKAEASYKEIALEELP